MIWGFNAASGREAAESVLAPVALDPTAVVLLTVGAGAH